MIAFQTPTEKFTLATCATYIAANPMFQTPTEKFTPSLLRHFLLILLVSNSNGEIYTIPTARAKKPLECFKLQRRNLHSLALSLSLDQYLVSNSNGEIYTCFLSLNTRFQDRFKLQRRNLHSVRNSIFSGYEY